MEKYGVTTICPECKRHDLQIEKVADEEGREWENRACQCGFRTRTATNPNPIGEGQPDDSSET